MKQFATFAAGMLLMLGAVAGLIDLVILIVKLVEHPEWTTGSYHQPVLTTLYLYGGTVCALLSIMVIIALVRGGWRQVAATAMTPIVLAGAVAGLWLPFIHVNEVDVATAGFRQTHYATGTKAHLTFYNATASPVTVCLGSHGTCRTATAAGPLPAEGITLQPGQTAAVTFPDAGSYPLTIVAPAPTMTATDTVVQSSPGFCDQHPDAQTCICGANGC